MLAWTLLIAPVVLILAYPYLQDYLHAAALLARISKPDANDWIARYDQHAVKAAVFSFEFNGQSIPADLEWPADVRSTGIVLLVAGQRLEVQNVGVNRLALALAATGYTVAVPQFGHFGELDAERASAEVVARSAAGLSQQIGAPKVGILTTPSLSGLADFAWNTPEGARSIAWVASGELIGTAVKDPQSISQLSLRERLALVHWLSLLLREARNSPASKSTELPAACWVMAHTAIWQTQW